MSGTTLQQLARLALDAVCARPLVVALSITLALVVALTAASLAAWASDPELFLSRSALTFYSKEALTRRKRLKQQEHPALLLALEGEVPNPFVSSYFGRPFPFSKLRLAIASATLVPLRAVLFALLLLCAWLVAVVGLVGAPPTDMAATRPLSPFRRALLSPIRPIFRAMLFILGYYTISQRGRPARRARAPIIVCNHVSFIDSMIMVATLEISFVGGVRWTSMPIVGRIGKALHTVAVDVSLSSSRGDALRTIAERARSELPWPPLVIFPEGTTTNGASLITFKQGAFSPGVSVQPAVVRYPHRHLDLAWVEAGPPLQVIVRAMLCRLCNFAEITWLPPYEPSADEVADPALFANNVRRVMALALGVPVTGHSLDDVALQREARHLQLPADAVVVEMERISQLFDAVDRAAVTKVLADFARIDKGHGGTLSLDEWLAVVADGEDPAAESARPELERIFGMLDVSETGRLRFKDYLLAVLLLHSGASELGKHRRDASIFAWNACAGSVRESLSLEQVSRLLCMASGEGGPSEAEAAELFGQLDANSDGRIEYAEFEAYLGLHPELLLAFSRRMLSRESPRKRKVHDFDADATPSTANEACWRCGGFMLRAGSALPALPHGSGPPGRMCMCEREDSSASVVGAGDE